jgi:hypothetical protein
MLIDDFYSKYDGVIPRPHAVIKAHNIAGIVAYGEPGTEMTLKYPSRKGVWSFRRPFPITWIEFSIYDRYWGRRMLAILGGEISLGDDLFGSEEYCLCGHDGKLYELGMIRMVYDKDGRCVDDLRAEFVAFADYLKMKDDLFVHVLEGARNLTLNFMHCQNVLFIENHLVAIDVKRRKQERRDWFLKFYTLDVKEMKKVLETEGQLKTNGQDRAWSLVRGYFKSYKEKPMFGKYFGNFFVPAHARGNPNIGMIFKDYRLVSEVGRGR